MVGYRAGTPLAAVALGVALFVVAVAVFHAGINTMGIYHPADTTALLPNDVPDPWLNLLAEVTGAVALVLVALLRIVYYGTEQLSAHETIGLGSDVEGSSDPA